jgi:hypothetical protein
MNPAGLRGPAVWLLIWLLHSGVAAPAVDAQSLPAGVESTPRGVYDAACAACHGRDGRGQPQATVGFELPLPDFTDCSFATREPDADWFAVSHRGGPARAFDRRMPAFGAALSEADIQGTLEQIRTFCRDEAWPRGELNLPRALVTEKAFPEDEAVLETQIASGAVVNTLLYEKRFGPRSQVEMLVPIRVQEQDAASWRRGLGDVAIAFKHALFHSLQSGRIFSAAGEVVFPTGKETEGLGSGVTKFEPFVSFGQILPQDGFLQAQVGFEFPANRDKASNESFWRVVAGRSFTQDEGFGRAWSPMIELLAARELEEGASVVWDIVPQMQVTLSRRQHIMINVGVRIPINERSGRSTQLLTYFLWDWFDGGLFDGWR